MAHQIHTKYYSPYYPVTARPQSSSAAPVHPYTQAPSSSNLYTHDNYNHILIHTLTHITGYNYYTTSWNH